MKKEPIPFKPGDRVEVEWEDIQINSTGDPKLASVARRFTMGYFRGLKDRKLLVFETHRDEEPGQEGWTAIPVGNVLSITGLFLTEERWGNEMAKSGGGTSKRRGRKGPPGGPPGAGGGIDGSIGSGLVAEGGK